MRIKTKEHPRRKLLKIFGGILVTAAAFYFCFTAFSGIDPSQLFREEINWWYAAASAALFAFATLIRAFVYPFGIDRDMSIIDAWQIVAIGNAANMILPFRAGEGVRLAVFPKRYSAGLRAKLTLIPGIADLSVILLFSIAAVFIADFKEPTYVRVLKIASYSFLSVCALTLIVLLAIPKTRDEVFAYLNVNTFKMLCWIVLSWLIMLISIWVGFLALGYVPLRSATLTFGAFAGMNIACLIPSSPGNIGIFEWSVITGLAGLGISEIPAKSAGLILHVIQYAALLPLGLILYLRFVIQNNRAKSLLFTRTSRHALSYKK